MVEFYPTLQAGNNLSTGLDRKFETPILIMSWLVSAMLINMAVFRENADLCGPHFTDTHLGGIV